MEHEQLLAEYYPLVQIGLAALVLIFATIARMGDPAQRRWPWLLTIGVALWVSDIPGTDDTRVRAAEFLWTGPVQLFVLVMAYAGVPLFVLVHLWPFLKGIPRTVAWIDYAVRRHPAEPVVLPALRHGLPIDAGRLADALTPELQHLRNPPAIYTSRNQTKRAEALKKKLDADAALAASVEKRERARAGMLRTKRIRKDVERR